MLFKDRFKSTRFSETDNFNPVESFDASMKASSALAAVAAAAVNVSGYYGESDTNISTAVNVVDYEVIWKKGELLGTGSFGQVYSGINLTNGERMAVKEVVLNPGKRHKQQVSKYCHIFHFALNFMLI